MKPPTERQTGSARAGSRAGFSAGFSAGASQAGTGHWQRMLVAVLAAAALVLTGCSAIPTAGQVQKIDELSDNPFDNDFSLEPAGPPPNATARQIVEGFISAGTGTANNYRTAREFLAPGLADSWRPDERTLVYQSESPPNIVEPPEEGAPFFVNLDLVRIVNEDGVSEPVPEGGGDIVEFRVTQLQPSGEWRITQVPDGIILSDNNFSRLFDAHNLYFYDPTYSYAVPDVRWFARRSSVPASLMRVLLEGPAEYLQGAVVSAFVDGAALVRPTVAIDSGEALVELSVGSAESVSALQLQRMQKQAELVLVGSLNTISSVELSINGLPVELPEGIEPVQPIQNKQVPTSQVIIVDDELALFEGVQSEPFPNMPSIAEHDPTNPAMSVQDPAVSVLQRRYAFLNGERNRLFTVAQGEEAELVLRGQGLTEPSFDVHEWLWTAAGSGGPSGTVYAARPGDSNGDVLTVAAQWLVGSTVKELKISRDGTRALIIAHQSGETLVMISGVIRNADGAPAELTQPLLLAPSVPADQGAWVDQTSVVVMKADPDAEVQAEILNLDAEPDQITGLEGMTHLSAGNGPQQIYGQAADGLYLRVGNNWVRQIEEGRDPSFAG